MLRGSLSKRRSPDAGFKYEEDRKSIRGIVFPTIGVALEDVKCARTVSGLAAEYGVHPTMIHPWKKALLDGTAHIFECGGKKPAAEVEEETARSLHARIVR